ncbi:MAG: sigma-54-dependent Fis family transcriptional regulator [Gammaproteobacteria bacterium]|jgi:sigma-54 specific flagellar transcriptional regulator A|nr:sigma-54-dependent Fis family transcriptional regulator [Gammaproteobacteria bacterium]MBT3725086.1 sigma-54-dependent Fis family transcriptional regulator [Gammaproteobacteria bacterium]MBT4194398.1 sigma-54-dependent Fis family transcriptional regulator [Gammaproteobacteria bacterium]MBT4448458.1 sigma-54-dependent Fis family transcriptional regulator [Gammaproteobacteria bacterium]MBT4862770.1 sigma-54-dependent Fis family transcriptional regulator [Gammaproteobacteria bacterium]
MTNSSIEQASNSGEILIVDTDLERAKSLQRLLAFIKYPADTVTPLQLVEMDKESLDPYLSIFTINDDSVRSFFLEINKKNKCLYPLVVVAYKQQLDDQNVVVHLPYITALCFEADYYSLSQVLDNIKNHNKRERRLTNCACQNLIGRSPAITFINHMIEQVADTTASVLISGESGTGKEVIARNIHAQSNRADKPFIPINCGAIPSDLLESELFGHEKGAFTGAISSRQGRFELAEGGVIFLDEIGDMPLAMQVKLLRVLQEHTYEKVGGNRTNKTNVRVIAATHRRLEDLIKEGKFREDLYYRLNVFPIEISPLRERRDDIPLLINELIERIEKNSRGSVRLTRNAIKMLSLYDWPGNVRELANLIERLAILYPLNVVDVKELPEKYISGDFDTAKFDKTALDSSGKIEGADLALLPEEGIDMKQHLTSIEVSLIEQALNETNNVVARAATLLHMRRTTLVEKMRKYEIVR